VTARTQSRRLSGWLNAIDCVVIAILQVIPAFVKFVDGAVIVGHNVSFDLRMLNAELQRLGAAEKENAFSLRRFKLQTEEHLPRQARGQAK
jgi:DNA polymerase III epsilon subunit-like protein